MNRRKFIKAVPAVALVAASASAFSLDLPKSIELQTIVLPKPEKEGGKSLLASLQERKTNRSISSKELPLQVISNLMWAAFGVNRDSGGFGKKGNRSLCSFASRGLHL